MGTTTDNVTPLPKRLAVSCAACGLNRLCLPAELAAHEVTALNEIIRRRRTLPRQGVLFHAGETMRGIYAVRCGAIKCFDVSADGEETVLGFSLPGELLGLEAVSTGTHHYFAVALEKTQYCEIPYQALQSLMAESTGIRNHVLRIMGQRVQQLHQSSKINRQRDARSRVLCFLADYSQRLARRGLDGHRFRLAMERREMANYLGLTQETVSRAMGTLQREGQLGVHGRNIQLLKELTAKPVSPSTQAGACRRQP